MIPDWFLMAVLLLIVFQLAGHFHDHDKAKARKKSMLHVCCGEVKVCCPNPLAHWTEDELVSGRRNILQ